MRSVQILLVFVFLVSSASEASPSENLLQVQASECPGGAKRSSTAFRVKGKRGAYAALHAVHGCKLTAISESGTTHGDLRISHVDVERDIALLDGPSLPGNPNSEFKDGDGTVVAAGQALAVVGHPLGLQSPLRTTLRTRTPASVTLRALMPPSNVFYALEARGSPNLNTTVISVEGGHLLPGHSGAPVVDEHGRIVGIANGGLERGTVEISWVVPWRDLQLQQSSRAKDQLDRLLLAGTEALFASERQRPTGLAPWDCFGRKLWPVKVLALNELLATVDDPVTYQHIVAQYDLFDAIQSFIVFRAEGGEVTLVVPEGWTRSSEGDSRCSATSPNAGFSLRFELFTRSPTMTAPGFVDLNEILVRREAEEFCADGFIIDPTASNWMARPSVQRGIIAMRKHFYRIDRRCGRPDQPLLFNERLLDSPAWTALPKAPKGVPGAYGQCSLRACENWAPTYPDVWNVPAGPHINFIDAWGFVSYVGSQQRALASWMKWPQRGFVRRFQRCLYDLSVDADCERLYAQQRVWAYGVIAATASGVSK